MAGFYSSGWGGMQRGVMLSDSEKHWEIFQHGMGNAVLKIWEGVYTSKYTNKIRDIISSNKSAN